MLHHALRIKIPPVAPTVTYVGSNNKGSTQAVTQTYTNEPIGTAAADRFVVVAVAGRGGASATVTIGGTNAPSIVTASSGSANNIGLFGLLVTSGTTATIVVTYNASSTSAIAVYNVNLGSASSTPTDTDAAQKGTSVSTISMTALTVPTNGVAIVAGYYASNGTLTWTGASADASVVFGTSRILGAAHTSTAGTNTITLKNTASNIALLVGAAWG